MIATKRCHTCRNWLLSGLIVGIFACSGSTALLAQTTEGAKERQHLVKPEIPARPENFRVGLRFAMAHFSGDVQSGSGLFINAENPFTPGGDLFFGYRFKPFLDFAHFGLKGLVGFRRLVAGNDNYKFVNYMVPVSVSLYAELFPISVIRPYGSAGVSFLPYQLDVKINRLPPDLKQQITGSERSYSFGFPLRIGLVYSISRGVDIEVTFEKELTLSDRMDGVVSSKRDNLETIGIGFLYYFYDAETADTDYDGITDEVEESLGMNIRDRDQDGDDLIDGDELHRYGTNPLLADTDADGLDDYDEIIEFETDALDTDTDNDGIDDYEEVRVLGTNPTSIDTDNDGVSDKEEGEQGTNPRMRDTDGDGISDGIDGCPVEAENINFYQDDDGCPDETPTLPATLKMGQVVIMENIEFASSSSRILNPRNPSIDKAYNSLHSTPSLRVEIGGHTDNTGNYDANVSLSLARAKSIKQILVVRGISAKRIIAKGYGPDFPIATNETVDGRARNRRIEFKIIHVE
jgi:outer membrane protein OmpA-like peptidoglycan-associated protein